MSTQDVAPEAPAEYSADVVPRRTRWRTLAVFVDWLKSVSLAVLLFVLVRALLVEAFKIPSGSMEGTLLVGDFLLVNKLVYGAEVPLTHKRLPVLRTPEHGDVVVFSWPTDPTKNFVKRIVGTPGDTLEMRDGTLWRNDAAVNEPYVQHTQPEADPAGEEFRWQRAFIVPTARASARGYHPSRNNWGPILVPPRHFFVLGDNRDNSLDSRYWGFLPDSLVRGRPLFVYYSYAPDSVSVLDWLTRIRWDRLGTRIE
jgi:signal peptidase I